MPKGPGTSSGKVKQDQHHPNRTHLYMRMKQHDCLQGIPPGQEFKCDPRYQPPAPPEMRGYAPPPVYRLVMNKNGRLCKRKV